jgi:uncharacterized protein DUF3828
MTSLFLRLTLMIAFAAFISQVPAANAEKTPKERIRDFYHWYMSALVAGKSPFQSKASELKQFVTERFLNEIDKSYKENNGLGADPFIQAQDFDNGWKSNIIVTKLKTTGSTTTAEVELKGKDLNRKLSVSMVRKQGAWKPDQVTPID